MKNFTKKILLVSALCAAALFLIVQLAYFLYIYIVCKENYSCYPSLCEKGPLPLFFSVVILALEVLFVLGTALLIKWGVKKFFLRNISFSVLVSLVILLSLFLVFWNPSTEENMSLSMLLDDPLFIGAYFLKNPEFCALIIKPEQRCNCFLMLARSQNSLSFCDLIKDESLRAICRKRFVEILGGNRFYPAHYYMPP